MKAVAFDFETRGLDWWDPDHRAFLVTWADETGAYFADTEDPEGIAAFRAAIDAAEVVIGHNLPFDTHVCRRSLGFDPIAGKVVHDTHIMSRVLFPEGQNAGSQGGHGLKNLATHFLAADSKDPEDHIKEMGKSIGLKTMRASGTYYLVYRAYPEVMIEYAVADARYTYDLWEKFQQYLKPPLSGIYELEMKVMPILIDAEELGVRTDQEAVQSLKAQYTAERDRVRADLIDTLGEAALAGGDGSEAALIDALLAAGVPLTETNKDGKLSTNKFVLNKFTRKFPWIEDLQELRTLDRFLSYYIGATEDREYVHTSFSQIGAWTGRMSARNPNMQNLPKRAGKEVRSIFVPREGHSFVVCDYESIEVRLLAYYLGDAGFKELVEVRDSHSWMASKIWGGTPEDYAKGGPNDFKRGLAKNVLFAITYGAGAPRVQAMLADAGMESTREEAQAIIGTIKKNLPNYFHLTKDRIQPKIKSVGYVNTMFGRKNPVNKEKAYVGLNALIQGSAADIMKQGLVNAAEAVAPLGGVPLLVVHDELVVEVPTENAEACLDLVSRAMVDALPAGVTPRLSVSGSIVTTSYADA